MVSFNKKRGIFLILFLMFLLSVFLVFDDKEDGYASKKVNPYINIDECSLEFMENYYEGMNKLSEQDNKDNILIVASLNGIKDTYGATSIVEGPNHQYFLQYDNEQDRTYALENFSKDSEIASVDENTYYYFTETNFGINAVYNSWGIKKTKLDEAIRVANSNSLPEIRVAILDTGVEASLVESHYPGKLVETYSVLTSSTDTTDYVGHGTHIAGTISEATPDNVKILSVKMSNSEKIVASDIILAINYVVSEKRADVINMSFSGAKNSAAKLAIDAAEENNIICVAAAGNDERSPVKYPAAYDNTIAVSAVDSELYLADYSNHGEEIDFAGPGTDVLSINGIKSGTSMATPHVVSAAAIIKSFYPDYNYHQVKNHLSKYAMDLGKDGKDEDFGYGLIYFNPNSLCDVGKGCLFKDSDSMPKVYNKLEVNEVLLTDFNYHNITNLMNTSVNLYYDDFYYVTKELWQLDGIKITGYDAFVSGIQTVSLLYGDFSFTIEVTNPPDWISGWEYEILDEELKMASLTTSLYRNETVKPKNMYIPSTIDGYTLTEMEDVFVGATMLNFIDVPASIKVIGDEAFRLCSADIKINAPQISVGKAAFRSSSIKKIDSVIMSLGVESFYMSDIESVNLSEQIAAIPQSAFYSANLSSIKIPDSVTEIEEEAFAKNTKLKNVQFSNSLETIGKGAFSDCKSLEDVILPDSLKIISNVAFSGCTNFKNIVIPKSVESIGYQAFGITTGIDSIIETITVSDDNVTYDSRDNSNAIIETATNKLIVASKNTIIPKTVKIIGNGVYKDTVLEEIELPEGVESVENYAFYSSDKLERVLMPKSLNSFGDNSVFGNFQNGVLWVYKGSPSEIYATKYSFNYLYRDSNIYDIEVNLPKTDYVAFDEVDTTGLSIKKVYVNGVKTYEDFTEGEITIKYLNEQKSFRYGDTYITVSIMDGDRAVEKKVPIKVSKAIPSYDVPTDLIAQTYQLLSEISLPDNFEWMDENQIITEIGNITYKAKYIPDDLTNYQIVENIDIAINVTKGKQLLVPTIVINDKVYDGSTKLPVANIIVTNIDSSLYSIEDASLSSSDVGVVMATVTLKLTDSAFKDYKFEDAKQSKAFSQEINIVPAKLKMPVVVEKEYVYTGLEQTFMLDGYDDTKMSISNNTKINAGSYLVKVSLLSANYTWDDGSSNVLEYSFKIEKALPKYETPTGLTAYTGQKLSEISLPSGFSWKDSTIIISESGEQTYQVIYTPGDTANYKIVDDIDVLINVLKAKDVLTPNIKIADKTYDGTKNIDLSTITITGIENNLYTIEEAVISSSDVGTRMVKVKLKLTDDAYKSYTFLNGSQVYEADVSMKINPAKLIKPTIANQTYTYNGKEQEFKINNYDSNTMKISGNKRIDAGEQSVIISLISSNYVWEDDSKSDLEFKFVIEKADSKIEYNASNNSVCFDGEEHGINLTVISPSNAIVRYADSSGDYVLKEMPKYKDIGQYTIKFRIYISDNYTDIYGEQSLIINKLTITNNSKDYEGFYDGMPHSIIIDFGISDYQIKYSIDNTEYNLDELPTFTEVGKYTVNYKVTSSSCEDFIGSNVVKIYGIKEIDSSIKINDNILIITDQNNSFQSIIDRIKLYVVSKEYKHYDKNNTLIDNTLVKTGDKLEILINGSKSIKYYISVSGEVNGDGKISALDYVKVKNHIMKANVITDNIYMLAADANVDDKISALDYVRIKNIIMKESM